MKHTLNEYIDRIKRLPSKEKYTKEDLIGSEFLIDEEKEIKVYYAPHNEYINRKAKVFIVGITPGFQQMSTAISEAKKGIEAEYEIEEIQYKCKVAGRFSGSLRKNIISMLDEIKLNEALEIDSCKELFEEKDYLLHTTSLIPYPVFIKGKNYTGHTPKLIKSDFLMKYVYDNFIEELKELDNILIIPLGKAVEEVLDSLVKINILNKNQILSSFPHPSGANGHRLVQLRENKNDMTKFVEYFFENI